MAGMGPRRHRCCSSPRLLSAGVLGLLVGLLLRGFGALVCQSGRWRPWRSLEGGLTEDVGGGVHGVLPAVLMVRFTEWSLPDLGCFWTLEAPSDVWLWWVVLVGCTLFLSMATAKQGAKNYPQIRAKHWSWATMVISAGGWLVYLLAYEFMFRGYLLFPLAAEWGFWPAAAASTLLYSLTHFHKGKGEVLWCLPVGILTCYMTYETGSLALTFLGHLVVSWYNTAYHVRRNKDMAWAGGWALEAP